DKYDMYPLGRAAVMGIPGLVQTLLDDGADINARNGRGWTALQFAARNGQPDTVRLLAAQGATINHRDFDG
ncbi:ankyrin, partial [Cadophora sp. DSE1049]